MKRTGQWWRRVRSHKPPMLCFSLFIARSFVKLRPKRGMKEVEAEVERASVRLRADPRL